jgi:hypothetical protein
LAIRPAVQYFSSSRSVAASFLAGFPLPGVADTGEDAPGRCVFDFCTGGFVVLAVASAEVVGVGGAVVIAALAGPILSRTLAHMLTLSIGNHRERNIDLLVRWQNKATSPSVAVSSTRYVTVASNDH